MDHTLLISIIAHLLIGFYFAFFGFWNIYHWRPILVTMVEDNIPLPQLVLSIDVVIQVVAGGMIMFGRYMEIAALVLLPFTIIAIFIFHPFWRGEHRRQNFKMFMMHITITVGALLLIINGN